MTETTITTPSWVQALDKYVASKPIEDVAADLGLKPEEIIMLVANENPNGMSSKVKEAVATAALNLNRYPDADAYHLQKAIAERYGVSQDWVVIGSGSSELLGLAAETKVQRRFIRSILSRCIRWLLACAEPRRLKFRQRETSTPTSTQWPTPWMSAPV